MEENMQHFQHTMLYYFKKGKTTTEIQKKKKICALYEEGTVTDRMYQKWVAQFMLEISHWTMLHSQNS